jgi:signal transduction histidine kinase
LAPRPSPSKQAARPRAGRSPRALAGDLRRLEAIFAARDWPNARVFARARSRARERAYAVLEGADARPERVKLALRFAAIELLGAAGAELDPHDTARIVAELEEEVDVPMLDLALAVLRAPELVGKAPPLAVRSELAVLAAFAKLRGVSLWTRDTADNVECVCHVGDGGRSRGARALASALLSGEELDRGPRRLLLAMPVGRQPQPLAALVASASAGTRARAKLLMSELSPLLEAILERDALLTNNAESQRSLVESSERKLRRLGFDLHDGPLQDVSVLADDIRLFGRQLDRLIESSRVRDLVHGRLEDIDAQLVAVDHELRRLSNEVNVASVLLNRSFESALRDRIQIFTARSGIEPRVTLTGAMNLLSTSQQIALLNIVHEALSNVREHARASAVDVSVSAGPDGVTAEVRDNGRGFELEDTLMRAAREGRIGLLAMHERVRLLGGRCRIQSKPGGPTVISIGLDLWQPLSDELDVDRTQSQSQPSA